MGIALIIWLGCGVVAAMIAGGKGRSEAGFGCLGFLLGPIGVIVASVISPDEQRATKAGLQSGKLRKCPACAEAVQREAIRCKHCGTALSPPEKRGLLG